LKKFINSRLRKGGGLEKRGKESSRMGEKEES